MMDSYIQSKSETAQSIAH